MKNCWLSVKLVWRLFFGDLRGYRVDLDRFVSLINSVAWKHARRAVLQVIRDEPLQGAASRESRISYCPSCGQRPTGDRRLDVARSLAIEQLGPLVPVSDINLALELNYWLRRRLP